MSLPEPSPLVKKLAPTIAAASRDLPVLDVACGEGRNAFVLAQLGCEVVCADRDLSPLDAFARRLKRHDSFIEMLSRLRFHPLDLVLNPWPFARDEFGAIINIHFFLPALLHYFEASLRPGGYLLIETAPGCGGNYRDLPKAGCVRQILSAGFDIEYYREGRAGPAVSVKAFARKRSPNVSTS
jgi:SAM-dependent methyltransferase